MPTVRPLEKVPLGSVVRSSQDPQDRGRDLPKRTKLISGCLSLLTINRFWRSRRVRAAAVRVWLGFGLGVSFSAIESLSDAV